MRFLAIGDIHGCSRALATLLQTVSPQPEDVVITLGDYVDRGPDSMGVIDTLLALRRRCKLIGLRGDNEQMMLKARDGESVRDWLECGGDDTPCCHFLLDMPAASGTMAEILRFFSPGSWQWKALPRACRKLSKRCHHRPRAPRLR